MKKLSLLSLVISVAALAHADPFFSGFAGTGNGGSGNVTVTGTAIVSAGGITNNFMGTPVVIKTNFNIGSQGEVPFLITNGNATTGAQLVQNITSPSQAYSVFQTFGSFTNTDHNSHGVGELCVGVANGFDGGENRVFAIACGAWNDDTLPPPASGGSFTMAVSGDIIAGGSTFQYVAGGSRRGSFWEGNLDSSWDTGNFPDQQKGWIEMYGDDYELNADNNHNVPLIHYHWAPLPTGWTTNILHPDGMTVWHGNSNGVVSAFLQGVTSRYDAGSLTNIKSSAIVSSVIRTNWVSGAFWTNNTGSKITVFTDELTVSAALGNTGFQLLYDPIGGHNWQTNCNGVTVQVAASVVGMTNPNRMSGPVAMGGVICWTNLSTVGSATLQNGYYSSP